MKKLLFVLLLIVPVIASSQLRSAGRSKVDTLTVSVTKTRIDSINVNNLSTTLVNASTNDLYVSFDTLGGLKGFLIKPNGSITYGMATSIPWAGFVYATSSPTAGLVTRTILYIK